VPADQPSRTAVVVFVGAGPGAADLVTVRGVAAVRSADVVVHDRLVPAALLGLIPPHVERVYIDRSDPADHDPGQSTGELLVRLAAAGRRVVRLKGGDPTVFARLAEELGPLQRAGVAVEIVPGVTAATAAAAAAGIPLTSREVASSLTIVTGHEASGKTTAVDFAALAAVPGTMAVYMGVEQIGDWSRLMLAAGRPGDTPVLAVSRCSWPDQWTATSTLAACAGDARSQGWRSPAVLIVGQVAAAAHGREPLAGRPVIVTRPPGQEMELVAMIRAAGGWPVHVPVIGITDPPSWAPLDDALGRLDTQDWIVFTSVNGVRGFVARLRRLGRDVRSLGTARLAAIGPATSAELEAVGLVCDLVPPDHRSEGLLAAFTDQPRGSRFLLVRATAGRDLLPRGLLAQGHHVEEVAAYASEPRAAIDDGARAATAVSDAAWITVTSGGIVEAAVKLFGGRMRGWRIASLSPVTSVALRRFGLEPTVEAAEPSMAALVAAIVGHERTIGPAAAGEPSGSAQGVQMPQGQRRARPRRGRPADPT